MQMQGSSRRGRTGQRAGRRGGRGRRPAGAGGMERERRGRGCWAARGPPGGGRGSVGGGRRRAQGAASWGWLVSRQGAAAVLDEDWIHKPQAAVS